MNRQNGTVISGRSWTWTIALIAAMILLPAGVSAHSPSDMQVSYDPVSQQLFVSITHQVPDPASHYVSEVVVRVNGRETVTAPYTSQPSPSSFTYTYPVNVTPGDSVAVSGSCSVGGSIQRSITVTGDMAGASAPGANAPAPTKSPLSIVLLPVMIAVVLLLRNWKSQ